MLYWFSDWSIDLVCSSVFVFDLHPILYFGIHMFVCEWFHFIRLVWKLYNLSCRILSYSNWLNIWINYYAFYQKKIDLICSSYVTNLIKVLRDSKLVNNNDLGMFFGENTCNSIMTFQYVSKLGFFELFTTLVL